MRPACIRGSVHCGEVASFGGSFLFVVFDEFEGDPVHGDYFRVERFADSGWRMGYGSSWAGDRLSWAAFYASLSWSLWYL